MTRARAGLAAVLVAVAVGAGVGIAATRHGTGLNPDSAAYLGTAWNVVHRHSVTVPFDNDVFPYPPAVAARFDGKVPLTQWPPAYPVALAAGDPVGLGARAVARLIDVLALAATAGLTAALVLRIRGRAVLAAATGVTVALAPATVYGYSAVLSDPLDVVFELAVLLSILLYVARPTRARLAAISVGLALAILTRFAAIALVPVAALAILLAGRASLATRWRHAAVAVAAAIIPIGTWSLVTKAQGGAAARKLAFYGVRRPRLRLGVKLVTDWFIPVNVGTAERLVVVAVVVAALVTAYVVVVRGRVEENRAAGGGLLVAFPVLLGFVLSYLAVLMITMVFVDAFTTVDARYLLPLFVQLVILPVVTFSALFERLGRPWLSVPVVLGVLVLVAWPPHVRSALRLPNGLYRVQAPRGGVYAAVKRLPRGALIISNAPDGLWVATQRPAVLTPTRVQLTTNRPNAHLERDIGQVATLMRERCAFLVALPGAFLQAERVVTVNELRQRFDLRPYAEFANGSVWTLTGGKPCTGAS